MDMRGDMRVGPTAVTRGEAIELARRRVVSVVDLDALVANYRRLSEISAPAVAAPVVKGDGYGLGLIPVATTLAKAGARLFLVARVEDGVELRAALPGADILVLDGLGAHDISELEAARLMPALNDIASLVRWLARPRATPAFIHIDSGMSRLGLTLAEAPHLRELLRGAASGAIAGYMTHFLNADEADHARCAGQVEAFSRALSGLPRARISIVNSAGLFLDRERAWRGDITRMGKALYGIHPLQPGELNPMQPVLSVYAPVLQVRDVAPGDTIGYGATFQATAAMRVAVLGIGYTNGYLRSLSGRGASVAFAGRRGPVVGRVSMDLTTVDVTDVPPADLEAGVAEVLGPSIDLSELSGLAGSNEHELQITLGRGCHRVYVSGGGEQR